MIDGIHKYNSRVRSRKMDKGNNLYAELEDLNYVKWKPVPVYHNPGKKESLLWLILNILEIPVNDFPPC